MPAKQSIRTVWRCVEPFAVREGRVLNVYGQGQEVLDDHPILKTHRTHFRPASEQVERMTAAPGELRATPIPKPVEATNDGA